MVARTAPLRPWEGPVEWSLLCISRPHSLSHSSPPQPAFCPWLRETHHHHRDTKGVTGTEKKFWESFQGVFLLSAGSCEWILLGWRLALEFHSQPEKSRYEHIHYYLCNIKVRSILLKGYLSSGCRESIPVSGSGENSRGLNEGKPGPWLPLWLGASHPHSHNPGLFHPTTGTSLKYMPSHCCFTSLCLYICYSLYLKCLLWICDNLVNSTYTHKSFFPKRLWAPVGRSQYDYLSLSTT